MKDLERRYLKESNWAKEKWRTTRSTTTSVKQDRVRGKWEREIKSSKSEKGQYVTPEAWRKSLKKVRT